MFQPVTIFGFTLPLISVILFGFAIVFLVAVQLARTVVSNKLTSLFESKLYDEFLETVDEPLSKFFVPAYNREYLRLNAHMAKGDAEAAKRSFDQLLTMRSSRTQRDDLLFKAFQFYMQQEQWDDAKDVLDEMEAAIDDAPYALKVSYALMLATQYASKGDEKAAEQWQDKARKMLEQGKKK